MKREIKDGQGFICKDLEEKKRIWEKLTDEGYKMYSSYEDSDKDYQHIVFSIGEFCGGFTRNITHPLNEAEFFGETEWTPKPGEWVEGLFLGLWLELIFIEELDGNYVCLEENGDIQGWSRELIRQIKRETMTRQEAQDKLRELLGKPNLTITP